MQLILLAEEAGVVELMEIGLVICVFPKSSPPSPTFSETYSESDFHCDLNDDGIEDSGGSLIFLIIVLFWSSP